jgi:hypothetical protein
MLAFTMQFSKHGQPNLEATTKPPEPTRPEDLTDRCGMEAGSACNTPLPESKPDQVRSVLKKYGQNIARSLRTQQCAHTSQTSRTVFPLPTQNEAVLTSGRPDRCE